MYPLQRLLSDYDMAMLRALAQNRGIALTTNRQPEAADQLSSALLDPLSIRVALARLSPQAQAALDNLVAAGGRMLAPQFSRQFGAVRPMGPGRLEREAPWKKPANPTEELWYGGLIFPAFHREKDTPGEFYFVPDDLLPLLPRFQNEPSGLSLETVPAPISYRCGEQTLIDDFFAYLVHLQTNDVRPLADGRLGNLDLAILRQRIGEPDDRRLLLLQHLAERLAFASHQADFLRLESAQVKRWLTDAPAAQIETLQKTWLNDATWNDLCHVPSLVCDQETSWKNDPVATRRALLWSLAHTPTDEWWTVASFVAAIKKVMPDFQRPDGDYQSWYIRAADSGEYLSGFEAWDQVEGALITDLLTGTLQWLGIVAIAHADSGLICRLTQSGATLLGLEPRKAGSLSSPPIVIRPDFRVEVPAPVNLYTRFQLERFAELENAEACRYWLTVSALGKALARGVRVDQILAFLRQASGGRVPTNVVGELQTWAGRYGQVQLHEVVILQVQSERVMRELLVLPETRPLISKQLSPTTALVRKQDYPRLRKQLQTLGYLPSE